MAALGGKAIGSGVILRIDHGEALIVTNRHVVDDDFPSSRDDAGLSDHLSQLGRLTVKMLGPAQCEGQVVWLAPDQIDLALVRVDARRIGPGPSSQLAARPADQGRRAGLRDRQPTQAGLVAHAGGHLATPDAGLRHPAGARHPDPGGDQPGQ